MKSLKVIIFATLIIGLISSTASARRYNPNYVRLNKYRVNQTLNSLQSKLTRLELLNSNYYRNQRRYRGRVLLSKRHLIATQAQALKWQIQRLKSRVQFARFRFNRGYRYGRVVVSKWTFVGHLNQMLSRVNSIERINSSYRRYRKKSVIAWKISQMKTNLWQLKRLVRGRFYPRPYRPHTLKLKTFPQFRNGSRL